MCRYYLRSTWYGSSIFQRCLSDWVSVLQTDLKDILRCCTQTSCPCSVFVETVGGSSPKAATASSSKPDSQDFLRDKRARSLNGQKSVPRGQIYIYIYIYIHGCDIHLEFSQLIDCDDLSRILYKVYNIFIYMIIYVYYIYKYIHRWLTSWCVVNNRLVCVVYCPSPSDIRIFFTGYTPPSRYVVFSRFWLEITHMYNITKDIIFVYITYIYIHVYTLHIYIYIMYHQSMYC